MKKKIILTTINAKQDLYSITADEFAAIAPNVQLGLLGTFLKSKGVDIEIIDSEADGILVDELIEYIEKEEPLLLGIICTGANPSSSTMTMAGIIDFFQKFNRKESHVKSFIWGPHPTVLPERTLKETGADFVVRGEGYETILLLFHALQSDTNLYQIPGLSYLGGDKNSKRRYIQTKDAALLEDLDTLPMIDWKMMNPEKYRAHNWHCFGDIRNRSPYAIIWTSFGCPFPCSFCCINNLFGKRMQRFRSIDSVINEISLLVEYYNVKHLKILDELFVVNPKRIEEFCDKLGEKGYDLNMWSYSRVDTINRSLLKKLKKVGMNWLSYGFESATPEILRQIKKNCKFQLYDRVIKMTQDEGVYICADIMFGLWEDNYETMQATYDFLERYNFEWVNIYPVFAYPGTEPYRNIEEPKSWKTYALYGYECVPVGTKYLTPREVLKFRDESFIKYCSRPAYLSMIEKKFGRDTKEHLLRMIRTPLKRRLIEQAEYF